MVKLFTRAGLRMTKGQQIDLSNSLPQRLSMEDYLAAVKGKSGASIAAFACAPAIAALAPPRLLEGLLEYGENLGVVIQLISDVREVWSASVGPDLMNGRLSLPVIYALESSSPEDRQRLLFVMDTIRVTKEGYLLRDLLDQLGVRMYVEMRIELYRRKARAALEPLSRYPELLSTLSALLDIPTFLASAPLI
jgi:geranylgeranyl pyrophosphate synthase